MKWAGAYSQGWFYFFSSESEYKDKSKQGFGYEMMTFLVKNFSLLTSEGNEAGMLFVSEN